MPALPRRTSLSSALVRLGVAAIGVFAAVGGGYELVRLLIERTDEFSFFAQFGGWQVDAMAAGLGLVLLALFVVSTLALVRLYRGLRSRTPNRRAVVMAALLPGLFLGGVAGSPMRSAISWASNRTAAAHKAYAEFREMLPTNPSAPPILLPAVGTAAAPALAARLLHPSDLGGGWYDGQRPNPSQSSGGLQGQALSVRTELTQWHWTGTMWSPGDFALESLRRFATPAAAESYLATAVSDPTARVRIGRVLVYEHGARTGDVQQQIADFAVGTDVFTVSVIGPKSTTHFGATLAAAVQRATSGR